jgi:hypothetical protein
MRETRADSGERLSIGELRHSLPFTVLVLPLAVAEIEAFFAASPARNVVK